MIRLGSVWRGLCAMRRGHQPVCWYLSFGLCGFWCELWTPRWHAGRGPYVSIGLGVVQIQRGY